MGDQSQHSSDTWAKRAFSSPWTAFGALFGTMALLLVIYLGVHGARTPPSVPWESAVRFSDDARFQPRFQVAVLERFFSQEELTRLTDIITKRCDEVREETLEKRRLYFTDLKSFLDRHWNKRSTVDRPSLPATAENVAVADADVLRASATARAVGEGAAAGIATGLFEKPVGQWTDNDVLMLPITNVVAMATTALLLASAETREKGAVLVGSLARQGEAEAVLRAEIASEIRALQPPLSFLWLYHEGSGWIFEVVFWTWFGVIANSVIAVILSMKSGDYDPVLFSLFIPKFFLAPLVSVVFVALWSAGVTQSEVTFLSLPWFMAFSFFLGFMTESLYARLRKFADAILGGATESSGRLPGGPGRDYHQWRNRRVDVKSELKPATLTQLEQSLRKAALGEVEHAIVTGMQK